MKVSNEFSSDESSSNESSSDESSSDESSSINFTKLLPIGEKYVRQNPNNGYVSVNDITKGTKKNWCYYRKNKNTKKFIKELKITTNLSKYQLITGSSSHNRWIHPYIAINFCQWISPQMSVQISKFVYNFISGSFIPSEFTKYIQTMSENKTLKIELELNKSSFELENKTLKNELESNKSSFERKNEKLIKELDDLKSNKSSFERKNEKLIKELDDFKTSKSSFERKNEQLKKELDNLKANKSLIESENEKFIKELDDLKSNKSSFELKNEKLKRKLRCFKNITIDNKNIKINNSKKYDLTISDNDEIILTVR
jgi:hypothetical protein